jgi:uncharacterized protein DUF4440
MTRPRITCFVALMCLAASRVVAQVPADLQKTMEERDQAVAKADAAAWDRLTADDFTLVDETGTFMTKAQRLAQIKTQKPTPSTAPQRVQVKRYGDAYARRFLGGAPGFSIFGSTKRLAGAWQPFRSRLPRNRLAV